MHPVSDVQPDATRNDIAPIEREPQRRDAQIPNADPWRRAASKLGGRRGQTRTRDVVSQVVSSYHVATMSTSGWLARHALGSAPCVAKEADNRKSEEERQVLEGPSEPSHNKFNLPIGDRALHTMRQARTDPRMKSHRGLASGEMAPDEGLGPRMLHHSPRELACGRAQSERDASGHEESHSEARGKTRASSRPGRWRSGCRRGRPSAEHAASPLRGTTRRLSGNRAAIQRVAWLSRQRALWRTWGRSTQS